MYFYCSRPYFLEQGREPFHFKKALDVEDRPRQSFNPLSGYVTPDNSLNLQRSIMLFYVTPLFFEILFQNKSNFNLIITQLSSPLRQSPYADF